MRFIHWNTFVAPTQIYFEKNVTFLVQLLHQKMLPKNEKYEKYEKSNVFWHKIAR